MKLAEALYTVVIHPVELVLEFFFSVVYRLSGNAGVAIIALSVIVNLLVFPLYKRADELQSVENARLKKMEPWVRHIKKTFRKDERVMMLRTYYRQNDYKPIYAVRGSVSLLLQIPFFIAAYRFLSELPILSETSFLFIRDLGAPDGLITLGGKSCHLLPLLMTLVSAVIYTKGQPIGKKIQPILLAIIFLILLYPSPAGLVFYWTLNNLFSLLKNSLQSVWKKNKEAERRAEEKPTSKNNIFWMSTVFMVVLTGVLIPSAVIKASPGEFVSIYDLHTPLLYVLRAFLTATGFFVVWLGLYYLLVQGRGKRIMTTGAVCICALSVINYMCVGTGHGLLSSSLTYDGVVYSATEMIVNSVEMFSVAALIAIVYEKRKKLIGYCVGIMCAACFLMSAVNITNIGLRYRDIKALGGHAEDEPKFELSKNGQNVVVIMLDKAIGPLVPYIFEERPELYAQFDGFTYYENTLSFGVGTKIASPALFGGYEYTPEKINARSDEPLVDKHDEALKVMPVLFDQNGYEVSVYDPSFAGYEQIPDLSIYDEYPDIQAYIAKGKYSPYAEALEKRMEETRNRNFFAFSLFKVSPVLLQGLLYDNGHYNDASAAASLGEAYGTGRAMDDELTVFQTTDGLSKATGIFKDFTDTYYVLDFLPENTTVTDKEDPSFWLMCNDTAHDSCYLQKPDYTPSIYVDNTAYDQDIHYEIDGRVMHMDNEMQVSHYHVNVAAYLKLGEWFDKLRELGVYDNTRIILVADHGCNIGHFDDMYYEKTDMEHAAPVLMVKDFNATGFSVSDEFMTNADTPTLATEGLIENPVNPMTGLPIDNSEKNERPQHITYAIDLDASKDIGNTYLKGNWYSVHDDMRDSDNWDFLGNY